MGSDLLILPKNIEEHFTNKWREEDTPKIGITLADTLECGICCIQSTILGKIEGDRPRAAARTRETIEGSLKLKETYPSIEILPTCFIPRTDYDIKSDCECLLEYGDLGLNYFIIITPSEISAYKADQEPTKLPIEVIGLARIPEKYLSIIASYELLLREQK